MKHPLFFQSALAAVIILTVGCGRYSGSGSVQVSPPEQVNLTASDNGQKITLFAGQELVIQLAGNPSTGYTWEAKDLDAGMFQQVGEAVFASSNPNLVGSGGSLTLTFRVLKTGPAALTLVYHRPWETNVAPLQTFSITATVK
ncbi:MAG: protease inhibitor I42 family protein [Anaerolineales bacterium]|jgi:inhibitor of cysteine peptidase